MKDISNLGLVKSAMIFLLLIAGVPGATYGQQSPPLQFTPAHAYSIRFLCGPSREKFLEGVVLGYYETGILVRNSSNQPVRYVKSFSRALPMQESDQTVQLAEETTAPGTTIQIECDEIRNHLSSPMTTELRDGVVRILSDAPLEVRAILSGRSEEEASITAQDTQQASDLNLICRPGYAGPRCAFQCLDSPDCEIESFHDREGNVISMIGRNTALFPTPDPTNGDAVLSTFKTWVAEHSEGFGFLSDVNADQLEIALAPSVGAVTAGGLTIHRFVQTYRGHPVAGSDSIVSVTTTAGGALSYSGTLANPAYAYEGIENPMTPPQAEEALETHFSSIYGDNVSVEKLRLVALPKSRQVGYAANAHVDGIGVGTAIIAAAPSISGEVRILRSRIDVVDNIDNQQPISARVEQSSSNPFEDPVDTAIVSQLSTGETLTGAEENGEFRLASPGIFLRDSRSNLPPNTCEMTCSAAACDSCDSACPQLPPKCTYYSDLPSFPSISSNSNLFLTQPGSFRFNAQDAYNKTRNMLSVTGQHLNNQWDSLLRENSDYPAGTFFPRIAVTLGEKSDGVCQSGAACATELPIAPPVPAGSEDFEQTPFNGGAHEVLGLFQLQPQLQTDHIVHEFGHIVDLFVHAGFAHHGVTCTGGSNCTPSCELGTSDEAPPLAETIANMYGIWAYPALFNSINPNDCRTLSALSLGSNTLPHNGTCREDGGAYALMSYDSFGPGYIDGEPTGACGASPGYRLDAIFQAWWELLTGATCTATPPYSCDSFEDELPARLEELPEHGLGSRAPQAAKEAFLYAIRVNSQTYELMFDNMAAYYACNFGKTGEPYEAFCHIAEHHDIISCDAPPTCRVCGNGELEPAEQCDDANNDDTDSCLSSCQVASCGDGFVWSGVEECDDENAINTDSCLSTCVAATCGDGFVHEGVEMCDDGNLIDGDGCSSLCAIEEDDGGDDDCPAGEPGCACLEGPDLPGGGLLGNDMFCNDDVTAGGNVRCVQDGSDFICESCTFNEGWGCPCGVGEDSCLFSESDPDGLGPDLFCWGHTQAELNFTGNCWDVPPEWYCETHCGLEDLQCSDPVQILCEP